MGISLVVPYSSHKTGVSHSATVRDVGAMNKKDSFSVSRHASADTLCNPVEVISKAMGSNTFVWTCDKVAIIKGFAGDFVNHGICTGGTPAGFCGQ